MDFLVGIDAVEDDELVEFAPPGRPAPVRARTDVLVNAAIWPAGPGNKHPVFDG
jgi:hypothetical protein